MGCRFRFLLLYKLQYDSATSTNNFAAAQNNSAILSKQLQSVITFNSLVSYEIYALFTKSLAAEQCRLQQYTVQFNYSSNDDLISKHLEVLMQLHAAKYSRSNLKEGTHQEHLASLGFFTEKNCSHLGGCSSTWRRRTSLNSQIQQLSLQRNIH